MIPTYQAAENSYAQRNLYGRLSTSHVHTHAHTQDIVKTPSSGYTFYSSSTRDGFNAHCPKGTSERGVHQGMKVCASKAKQQNNPNRSRGGGPEEQHNRITTQERTNTTHRDTHVCVYSAGTSSSCLLGIPLAATIFLPTMKKKDALPLRTT